MASKDMGVKKTKPEKAKVKETVSKVSVSQSMHLAFQTRSPLTFSLSDTGATRLKGIPEAG